MTAKKYEVLFMGENVWTIGDQPMTFDSFEQAMTELDETFTDMDQEGIDYSPEDYRIEEVRS